MILLSSILILFAASALIWQLRNILPSSAQRGWLLAIFPALSFAILLNQTIGLEQDPSTFTIPWLQNPELNFTLYFDALSALFGLIVTGIGTLIIIYAGYYFANDKDANRFLAYLMLFMSMMLGLVLAGDVITLFIFWEGTSITSFLLVAYKYKYESARKGAFRALFITGGGGIALLAGLLFVTYIAGGSDFATILASGSVITQHELYLVALGLVAFGAFTKSAQFPAHIWLPGAMSAPTPASAYLHSATMVKAGIYLLARLNPALGNTEAWFWLLSVVGLVTMFVGAYVGTQQSDLKALLAYSTISQLGILVMLIGQDTEIAFKALIIGLVAHAFYKSALFMGAGIIDHEAGTRDLSKLGGLRHSMPFTFVIVTIAALSLAGLPPMFGFLAKETLLATAVHPTLPTSISWIFAGVIVVAAALKLVQAGLLIVEVFLGNPKDASVHSHEAPKGMLLTPAIPALISLGLGILPEPKPIAEFFGSAAAVAYGDKVKVSFALWTGLNIPLLLSTLAIASGIIMFWQRNRLFAWQKQLPQPNFNRLYEAVLSGIDKSSYAATRVQTGDLRFYLGVIILSMLGLVTYFGGWHFPTGTYADLGIDLKTEFSLLKILALLATVGAGLATIVLRRDFYAILALSAAGLGVAMFMAVEPAPDVALVQIVVDILATVILIMALRRLPRSIRQKTQAREINWKNLLVASISGLMVTMVTLTALISRDNRNRFVTEKFEETAKDLTGATDIVGAIIVDFRALDTLIEIAVFSLAGLGVYTLLRYATQKHNDIVADDVNIRGAGQPMPIKTVNQAPEQRSFGIAGKPTSSYVRAMVDILLPVAFMIAAVHMLTGHDRPGDGFTAGVIASLAVGFSYVVNGFEIRRTKLSWISRRGFIATGILLVLVSGGAGWLLEGSFLASVDYGKLIGLTLPSGIKLSSGFVFEVAIGLAVLGSVTFMLDTLGRPATDIEKRSAQREAQQAYSTIQPANVLQVEVKQSGD